MESTSLSTKMFGVAVLCIAVAALTTGLGLQQKSGMLVCFLGTLLRAKKDCTFLLVSFAFVVRKRRMSRLGRSTLVTEIESNLSIAVMVSMLDKYVGRT